MNFQKKTTYWIEKLNLKPHKEGGYFSRTYTSNCVTDEKKLPIKHCASSIYYLLEGNDFSAFHRIKSDEIWYFHLGCNLKIHEINPKGNYLLHILGIEEVATPQILIKANSWFAAECATENSYSLVSCMVCPEFVFSEFEMAQKNFLIKEFPQYKDLITRLCRS